MTFFSKFLAVFKNADTITVQVIRVYTILSKIKPALEALNKILPDNIKDKTNKTFSVLDRVISGLLTSIATVAGFFRLELPTVTASSADPIKDLEDSLQ